MNEKEAVTPVLSLCNSPFLYFSSLSSSSYCITGALQGFLQPSYRWQAAFSIRIPLRSFWILLRSFFGCNLFCLCFRKFLCCNLQSRFFTFQLFLQCANVARQCGNLGFNLFLVCGLFSNNSRILVMLQTSPSAQAQRET